MNKIFSILCVSLILAQITVASTVTIKNPFNEPKGVKIKFKDSSEMRFDIPANEEKTINFPDEKVLKYIGLYGGLVMGSDYKYTSEIWNLQDYKKDSVTILHDPSQKR